MVNFGSGRFNPKESDHGRDQLKCDGTRAETRFRLSAKRTSLFKSAGASAQSTTGSRGVRISRSNAGYIMFRGSVKSTDYPLHSPVSSSLPIRCVTVCHHTSTGVYKYDDTVKNSQQAGMLSTLVVLTSWEGKGIFNKLSK